MGADRDGPAAAQCRRGDWWDLRRTAMAVSTLAAIAAGSLLTLPVPLALASCVLGAAMLVIAVEDVRRFIVPDVVSLPAIPVGLLASGHLVDRAAPVLVDPDHVIGALAGGIGLWLVRTAYSALRGREGLGFGDVKLAAAAGAWTGWLLLPSVLLVASVGALAMTLALAALSSERISTRTRVPFGAYLAAATWAVWFSTAYHAHSVVR